MQLSEINSSYNDLTNSDIILPLCACAAYDNGLWIYDENTDKIMRYDNMNKLCNETMMLNLITNEKYIPQQIQESVPTAKLQAGRLLSKILSTMYPALV